MPNFSANLSMLFTEVDFLDRFERAAKAGFKAVEYLFPYAWSKDRLADELKKHKLKQVLFNLPAGNWDGGERGIACLPGREGEFQKGVEKAVEYAAALRCPRLNCLVGLFPEGESSGNVRRTLIDNLKFAADALEKADIKLLVEPLNSIDIPGFYLVNTRDTLRLFEEVNHPNLWLQYDIYHMQIMEGDLIRTISNNIDRIAHMQLADNPGRHEPGTGEINYPNVFRAIDETGYDEWIGCEYKPVGTTEEGLSWIKRRGS